MTIETQQSEKVMEGIKQAESIPDEAESQPFVFNTDFRPKGPQGNEDGTAARQRARMNHLQNMGRGILMNEAIAGNLVVITPHNGGLIFELVSAREPIPEREMVPGSKVDLNGVFTPFEPTGKSFSMKVNDGSGF